jgi:hypothetical protein
MNIPGFTADASVYKTRGHYWVSGTHNLGGGRGVVPQLSLRLNNSGYDWCGLACDYCYYYGWYCWPCFICSWFEVIDMKQVYRTR